MFRLIARILSLVLAAAAIAGAIAVGSLMPAEPVHQAPVVARDASVVQDAPSPQAPRK